MITPMDLRTKSFKKAAVGGYDKREVDEYMQVLTEDYEKVYKQSVEATDKINTLTKLLETYKSMEETMKNSIIVAQSAAEDLENSAEEKAKLMIEEAKLNAAKIISEAEAKAADITAKMAELKASMELFKNTAKGMLAAQLEVVEKFSTEE